MQLEDILKLTKILNFSSVCKVFVPKVGKLFLSRNLIDNPKYCENENNSEENFNLRVREYKEHLKLLKRKHKQELRKRNVQRMHPYTPLHFHDTFVLDTTKIDEFIENYSGNLSTFQVAGHNINLSDALPLNFTRPDIRSHPECLEGHRGVTELPAVRNVLGHS